MCTHWSSRSLSINTYSSLTCIANIYIAGLILFASFLILDVILKYLRCMRAYIRVKSCFQLDEGWEERVRVVTALLSLSIRFCVSLFSPSPCLRDFLFYYHRLYFLFIPTGFWFIYLVSNWASRLDMTIMHRKFFLLSPGVWNQERMERMKAVHPSIRVASKKKK